MEKGAVTFEAARVESRVHTHVWKAEIKKRYWQRKLEREQVYGVGV